MAKSAKSTYIQRVRAPQHCIVFGMVMLLCVVALRAAPPIFDSIGDERMMNSCLFFEEGTSVSFTVHAKDPDGDTVTYTATNLPSWGLFTEATGEFLGNAPPWPTNIPDRYTQFGVFDSAFMATANGETVTNIITLHITASNWTAMTMSEMVANRPLDAGGAIGTPVDLAIISDAPFPTPYGGGKTLRRIVFSFTSQVSTVTAWKDDWVALTNIAYLPQGGPAIHNAGGVIEGLYSGDFGEEQFAVRTCAELDLPMLIIDRDWPTGYGGELMSKYNERAVDTGNPLDQFYVFSSAHFLRAADALASLIDTQTSWPITYTNFQVVFTGHSKFGQTCSKAAAAAPARVAGFMATGCPDIDTGATRLLALLQGAQAAKPDSSTAYLGTMMRYYTETLALTEQMSERVKPFFTLGTDDDKGVLTGYTPKYILGVSEAQMPMPVGIGMIPNAPHTTSSDWHSVFWRMWVAHCLLDRPISTIDSLSRYPDGGSFTVTAEISGAATVQSVRVWSTTETDLNTNHWVGFSSDLMTKHEGSYTGMISGSATAFYIQVTDLYAGITGIVTTAAWPTDADYPLLREPPDAIPTLHATQSLSTVYLNWTNPPSGDLLGTLVRYGTNVYPVTPLEGADLYDGSDTSCTHSVSGEDAHCYGGFTYDAFGNYSLLTPAAAGTPTPLITAFTVENNRATYSLENLKPGATNCLETTTNLLTGTWTEQTNFIPSWITTNLSLDAPETDGCIVHRITVASP